MKIVKITSIACTSCIIMNNILDEVIGDYDIDVFDVDYLFDDISSYDVGKVLPVIIFYDDNGVELSRLVGEHKKEELIDVIRSFCL